MSSSHESQSKHSVKAGTVDEFINLCEQQWQQQVAAAAASGGGGAHNNSIVL